MNGELNKAVIEKLADPLVHLLRNAIDHGLEMPEVRRAAGKPSGGRITLSARHTGAEVLVSIADDGRGPDHARRRIPVAMCSTLTEAGSETLMQALEASTVEIILKSKLDAAQHLLESRMTICDVVKTAGGARLRPHRHPRGDCNPRDDRNRAGPQQNLTADVMLAPPIEGRAMAHTTELVACIGASTGVTESLHEILEALPADSPEVVIVQHMPEKFTAALARRLDSLSAMELREAVDGDTVLHSCAPIAPGNFHMLVARHRPLVDVLFRSAIYTAGRNALGIIMTGIGDDGARSLLEMRKSGAATIAQDEANCVAFGMPKEAITLGRPSG